MTGTTPSLAEYRVADAGAIPTPALLIYEDRVDANIRAVLAQCGGDAHRWRPHVKTAKVASVMQQYLAHGITSFKCATTKELRALLDIGAPDILLSFPVVGATAQRVRDMAARYSASRISVLMETAEHLHPFSGSGLGVFIDCNPGMDRTGRDPANVEAIGALIDAIEKQGCHYRGIHWYDGHLHSVEARERERVAHAGYDRLMTLLSHLTAIRSAPSSVIVAGTPASPYALSYPRWGGIAGNVQISPGTVVFNDTTSLTQMPRTWGLVPAALVLSSVVSHPRAGRVTCDAGHKSVSADAGVPTCAVLGHDDWKAAPPSEEHLPIDCGADAPAIGTNLFLLPRHICPTVNNFDEALIVRNGRVERAVPVTARGHDGTAI